MKLRGITRLAAAAVAATALLVGGLGAPAFAGDDDMDGVILPGATLVLDDFVFAAEAPTKGCAGIDTGTAVADRDGWLFNKPKGKYTDLQYIFLFIKDGGQDIDDIVPIVLNADGVFTFAEEADPKDLAKSLKAKALAANKIAGKIELPTAPAPAGVGGSLTTDGGWLRTPAGWALALGAALTDPLLEGGTFDLVRACAAAAEPTTSASPSPVVPTSPTAGGGSLPVTGTNVWMLSGAGLALIAVGAVLFMAYRRRQSVKFVA